MNTPDTIAERQVAEILEKEEFGDSRDSAKFATEAQFIVNHARTESLIPQSYKEQLHDEIILWKGVLIPVSAGGTAGLTASLTFRILPAELAVISTGLAFVVGVGIGELLGEGVGRILTRIKYGSLPDKIS